MQKFSVLAVSSGTLEGGQNYASIQVIEKTQFVDNEYKTGFVSTKLPVRQSNDIKIVDMNLAQKIRDVRKLSTELLVDIELEIAMDMTKAKPEMVVTGINDKKAAK